MDEFFTALAINFTSVVSFFIRLNVVNTDMSTSVHRDTKSHQRKVLTLSFYIISYNMVHSHWPMYIRDLVRDMWVACIQKSGFSLCLCKCCMYVTCVYWSLTLLSEVKAYIHLLTRWWVFLGTCPCGGLHRQTRTPLVFWYLPVIV